MSGAPSRVFVARLAGLAVFDPAGGPGRAGSATSSSSSVPARPCPRGAGSSSRSRAAPGVRADDPGHRAWTPGRSSPPAWSTCAGSSSGRPRRWCSPRCSTARCARRGGEEVTDRGRRHGERPPRRVASDASSSSAGRAGAVAAPRRDAARGLEEVEDLGVRSSRRARRTCSQRSRSSRPADLAGVLHELTPKRRAGGRRRSGRRQARRRPGGAARGRPGRDPRPARRASAPPTCSRRWQPDDAADLLGELPDGAGRAAAGPDGAGRGRRRPAAARLRGVHGRRDDDAGAGDPAAGRHRGGGAGPGPPRRAHAGAGVARSTSAGRRWRRPRAASRAWSTSSGCSGSRRPRCGRRRATRDVEPSRPDATLPQVTRLPGHVQPGRRSRSSTRPAGCSARSPSTTCSTTCCPRTGARRDDDRPSRPRWARRGDAG